MRASQLIIVFVAAVTVGYSHPTAFQCSRYCKEDWNRFGYEIGNSYLYDYTGVVKSAINATVNDRDVQNIQVFLRAKVQISVLSACDFGMQISDAKFEESYNNKNDVIKTNSDVYDKFNENLERNVLYFSFSNGRIETVCPDQDEEKVVNLKKGILSAFQNSMPSFENDAIVYETDVSGNCETHYQIKQNTPNLIVEKVKRLEACSHRKSRHVSWLTVPYTKNIQNNPSLLRSSQSCTQQFNRDLILESNECVEKHLFQPFSNGENGAVTYLTQSLRYERKVNGILSLKTPTNFQYETLTLNYNSREEKSKTTSTVLKLLKELEMKTNQGIEPSVPKLFSLLVQELQNSGRSDIASIFRAIEKSSKQKKFALDAMSLVTTIDGIKTMTMLYSEDELSHSQMNSWLTSMNFLKDATLEILEAMTPLLNVNKAVKQKASLTISSLVYKYCREDKRCSDKQQIKDIVKIIAEPISDCVPSNLQEQNEILLSLKAIGNMGLTTSMDNLKNCFWNDDSPMELRLAAIAAHRRINCADNENLEYLEDNFANIHENTEIRIASYLAAMQCASYATFARIKDVLRTEETNQVGSFVWTHLTNIQETSSPWKRNLKSLIENEFLRNKFSTDMRKYSRNYEVSTYFDSLNTGTTFESNVIFTSESYLPKSAMFNFTLDLFGEAVNIFEVGARMEGFEQVFENLFGPEGYFPEESIRNVLENVRVTQNKSTDKIQELRDSFASQVSYKEPNGLIYAKVFGNEIAYTHFKKLENLIGGQVNSGSILEALMRLFRQQDIDYINSFVFLDSSYKIPTLLGFPLELTVNGTATIGLTVKSKMELKDLWAHKLTIEGKIYPSATVQVIGTMTIDTVVNRIGLRSENKLNSNTYLDGHAFINKGKLVDLKLNVPKQEMNVINAESQIYIVQGDQFHLTEDITDNVESVEKCTKEVFNTVTGLQFCYNLHYVNASQIRNAPYFPLTGRFKYSVDVKKTDTFDSYQLKVKTHTEVKNYRPIYFASFYLDTPNSKTDRKIDASYLLNCEKLSLTASLASPFVSLDINSKIGDDYDNLGFVLQTKLNDNEIFSANMSLKSTKVDNTWKYVPLAMINYKNKQIAALSGNVNYLQRSKYNADLKLEVNGNEPVRITGDLSIGHDKFQLAASIKSQDLKGNARAIVLKNPESLSIVAETIYDYRGLKQQVVNVEMKAHSSRKQAIAEESLYISVNSTQNPLYNTLLSISNQRGQLYLETKATLGVFGIKWNGRQLLKFLRTNSETDVAFMLSLQCLQRNIDYGIDLSYIKSYNIFKIRGLLQLNHTQRIESLISYNMIPETNRTLDLMFYYPKQLWELNGIFTQQNEKRYTIFLHGFYEMEQEKQSLITLSGEYVNSTVDHFQNHTVTGVVKIPDDSIWSVTSTLQISPEMFLNTAQIRSRNVLYVSHLTWTKESVTALVQGNEKQLLLINGFKNEREFSISFGLNVYQHFELSVKLLMPYRKFQFVFYWDKDRDLEQKFALFIDHHANEGLYLLDLTYPNQKVTASFILLPRQVTMNVTWGTDLSKRIYLKAGNKIFDIGGIWFAKLETPFQYLETQEFKLSYYIIPQNAELKVDIFWRDQKINLIMSGIKSSAHLSGYLDLNTTLPELSKISIAVSHSHNTTGGLFQVKNDATFVLNQHQITGQSLWRSQGTNVSSSFEIVSPSGIIEPVIGSLNIDNNHTTNHLNGFVNWRQRRISVDYKFENSQSYIRIRTPFEGLEVTELDYTILGEADKLILEVRINLLTHLNHALLSWNNEGHSSSVQFQITCPIIGSYEIIFRHSTVFGHLDEYLVVTQGQSNDILAVKLQGNLVPILMMDVNANIKILEHKASLVLKNDPDPLRSKFEANWDDAYITSDLLINFSEKEVSDLMWNVGSSMFEGNVSCVYARRNNSYTVTAVLPKGYKLNNVLNLDDYKWVDSVLNTDAAGQAGFLIGLNRDFDNKIMFRTNSNESKFMLSYDIDEETKFVDALHLKFVTPWYHPITLNYNMRKEGGFLKPSVYLEYSDKKMLEVNASVKSEYLHSELNANVYLPFTNPFDFEAKYDFSNRTKMVGISVTKEDDRLAFINHFMLEKSEGFFSANATVTTKKQQRDLAELLLRYDVQRVVKLFKFRLLLPEQQQKIELDATASMENGANKYDAKFLSSFKDWEKVYVNVLLGTRQENHFIFGRNHQNLTTKCSFNYLNGNGNARITLESDFETIQNCSLELSYGGNAKAKELSLATSVGNYNGSVKANYELTSKITKGAQQLAVNGALNINYCKKQNGERKQVLDIDAKTDAIIESKRTGSSVTVSFTSNVPKLEKLDTRASYEILKKGYNVKADLVYNKHKYFLEHHLQHLSHKLDCSLNIETPRDLYGNVIGNFVLVKSNSEIDGAFEFNRNSEIYNASLTTNYNALLSSNTVIKFTTPDKKYNGEIIGNFSLTEINVKLDTVIDGSVNEIDFCLKTKNYKKSELSTRASFGLFQVAPWVINLKYDLTAQEANVVADINNKDHKLELLLDRQKLNLVINKSANDNFFILTGSHDVSDFRDLSFAYTIYVIDDKIKIDFSNKIQQEITTSLVVSTTIKNWSSVKLRSVLHRNRFEVESNFKEHSVSLIANRNGVLSNQKVLQVKYNQTPFVLIWSGSKHSYLQTTTPWGNYKLLVDYPTEPVQYSLTILEENSPLISLTLSNIHTESYLDFSGKLNSVRFQQLDNLTVYFYTDYKIPNELKFSLDKDRDNLVSLSYALRLVEDHYRAAFDFKSVLDSVQACSVAFDFQPSFLLQLEATSSRYNVKNTYKLNLSLPLSSNEAYFELKYPYGDRHYATLIELKEDLIHLDCRTPFDKWKKIVVKTGYTKVDTMVNGFLKLQKNNVETDAKWSYGYDKEKFFINIDTKNTADNELTRTEYVFLDMQYLFSSQNIAIICKIDELGNKLDFNYNKKYNTVNLKTKLNTPMYDFYLNTVVIPLRKLETIILINNDEVLNVTASKSVKGNFLLGECDVKIYNSVCHYNFLASYDRGLQKPVLRGLVRSKTNNYLFNADVRSEITTSYQSGNITFNLEQGLQVDEPGLTRNNYEVTWLIRNSRNNKLASASYQKNRDLTSVTVAHAFEDKKLTTELQIACGEETLDLSVNATIDPELVSATIDLRTPLEALSKLTAEAFLIHDNQGFEVRNTISWPEHESFSLGLVYRLPKISLQILTPFNLASCGFELTSATDGTVHIKSNVSLGAHNASLVGTILPSSYLTLAATSTFTGYSSINVTASYATPQKTLLYFQKETLILHFVQTSNLENNGVYEINMKTNDDDQDYVKLLLKLETVKMKLGADLTWGDESARLEASYNPNSLSLELTFPFQVTRNVQLRGVYLHGNNTEKLLVNGAWNELALTYRGSVYFSSDFMLESQLELDDKTSNRKRNAEFAFAIEKIDSGSRSRILVVTPFESFTKASAELEVNSNSISSSIRANLLKEDLIAEFRTILSSASAVSASMLIDVPQVESKWNVRADVDAYNRGYFNVSYRAGDDYNDFSLKYDISGSTLTSSYTLNGTKANTSHDMEVCLKSDNFTAAVDDYRFTYQLIYDEPTSELIIETNLPNYEINSGLRFATDYYQYKAQGVFFYNSYKIRSEASYRELGANFSISSDLGRFYSNNIYGELGVTNNGYVLKTNMSDADGVWLNTTISYINNAKALSLTTWSKHSLYQPYATNFYIDKLLEKIVIDVQDVFSLDVTHTASSYKINASVKAQLKSALLIEFDRDNFNFLLDSVAARKNINIKLKRTTSYNGKQIEFYYSEKEKMILKGGINLQVNKLRDGQEFLLSANASNQAGSILEFSGSVTKARNATRGASVLSVLHTKHRGYFVINTHESRMIGFSIGSPFVPYDGFTVKAAKASDSFFLFGGAGLTDLTRLAALTAPITDHSHEYVLLEAAYVNRSKISLKYQAPASRLKLISFQTELKLQGSSVTFYEDFHVKSDYNISISSRFTNTDALHAKVNFVLPFVSVLPSFEGEVLIPFGFSDNFNPKIVVGLPDGYNSVHVLYKRLLNEFVLSGGYQYGAQKLNAVFQLSKSKIFAQVVLPFVEYNHFELSLQRPKDFSHESEIDNYLVAFKHRFEMNYNIVFSKNRHLIKVIATSTIASYEKFSVDLQYENEREKILRALVFYPSLEREFGFDFDVSYRNLKDFKLKTLISLPIKIRSFNYAEFTLSHNLDLKTRNKTHSLKYYSKFNEFASAMDLSTILTSDSLLFDLSTQISNQTFFVSLKSIGSFLAELEFVAELRSPFDVVQDLKLYLLSSINFTRGLHSGVVYNSKEILATDFVVENGEVLLNVSSIWRSVSAEYKYLYNKELEVKGRICWDTNNPDVSQLGGHLVFGKNFSVGILLPTRVVSFDANYFIDKHNEYYFAQVSWYKDRLVAFKLSFINVTIENEIYLKSSAIITLPFRTFEITDEVEANFQATAEVKSKFTLKWGKDERSQVYLQNYILSGQLESRLFIPILEHEIVTEIDMSHLAKIPSRLKASLQYSDDPERRIELLMFYNKSFTNIFHTEREFILKHPASKLDYSLSFSTTRTPEYTVGYINLKYRNYALNRHENIRSSLRIGHEKFEVSGEIETSKNYLSASCVTKSGTNYQGFQIDTRINKQEPLSIEGVYNFKPTGSSVSLTTSSGDNRMYNFYAGFPSKREITAKLIHELYNVETTDALATVKLNSSQLLWMKLNWKYQFLPHFKSAILEEYHDVKYIVEATGQQLIDVLDDDLGQTFIKDVSELKKNLTSYAKQEGNSFKQDYKTFLNEIKDGYRSNSFFCKDIERILKLLFPNLDILDVILLNPFSDLIRAVYDSVFSTFTDIFFSFHNIYSRVQTQVQLSFREVKDIKRLKARAKEILKNGINEARKSLKETDILVERLLTEADEYLQEAKVQMEQFFEPYLKLLDDFVMYLEQRLAILQMLVLDILETIQHYVLSLKESRELLKIYMLYANWLEEFHISDILEPVADVIEVILETLITDFKKVMDDYRSYVDSITEAMFGNYKGLTQLPPISELREALNNMYQRTLWIWNYHNLTETIKNSFRKFVSDFDDYLASLMELDNSNDFENILGQSDYVIRPDLGLIEVTQPLPVEWEAFDEVPYFQQYPLYQKIKKRTESLIQIQRHHFLDLATTINNYMGESPKALLSPPTNNIAVLIGKSHYVTFDKKYYNFAGECSYLLAGDFISKTFSVAVNYELANTTITKKSIEIISGYNSLEVSSDFTVKFNNQETKLPLMINSLTVLRENNEIFVENDKGLKVICNIYYDYCIVELSGWLFGKTGGLLGTLDNEKITDMSLPGGDRTSDVLEFVQSWQVGSHKCGNVNHANDNINENISPLSTTLFETLCQVFFVNANSPLGHCFSSVDPKPFYEICVSNMKDAINPTLCPSVAAYRAQCKVANIDITMPEMCVHCKNGVSLNEDIFDGNNPKSIDVVIIKETSCASLNNLPNILDNFLSLREFNDNKFALVGYGSGFPKPFVYYTGKEMWSSSKNATENMKMHIKSESEKVSSGIEAIKFASNLEFRPGVSKLFVVIRCSEQPDVENLNNFHNMFGDKDITLHVLKLTSKSDEELIEMDNKGHVLYVKHGFDIKNFQNKVLNTSISVMNPNEVTDIYNLMALSSNGTVLNVDNTNTEIENVITSWSKVVTETVNRSPCQKCKCVINSDGTGKTECTRCMSPTVKQLLNEYESNVMEFHSDSTDEDYF